MNIVTASAVTKMWTPDAGLGAVDVEVAAGELVMLRGRSGSGKSTLLALLAGLCQPDSGTVRIDARPPAADDPWSLVAVVPQVLALAVELSVRENVTDAATGITRPEVDTVLAQLDLAAVADRTVEEISMGQQQRTAIARAIAAQPHVLLADEPTSFQGADHTATVVAALLAVARAGSAVVVASHDPAVAAAADRIVDLATHVVVPES